jgi:hypothetical protein
VTSARSLKRAGRVLAVLAIAWSGCTQRVPVTFREASAPRAARYKLVAVVPLVPVGSAHSNRESEEASDIFHRILRDRAPFPVWDRLLDVPDLSEVRAPIQREGQTIDALLFGRMRFYRTDRSTWESSAERAPETQGQPLFVRRTAYRLDVRIVLRDLRTGQLDIDQAFSQEILSEEDNSAQSSDAFVLLTTGAARRLLDVLSPAPIEEHRELLLWKEPRDSELN